MNIKHASNSLPDLGSGRGIQPRPSGLTINWAWNSGKSTRPQTQGTSTGLQNPRKINLALNPKNINWASNPRKINQWGLAPNMQSTKFGTQNVTNRVQDPKHQQGPKPKIIKRCSNLGIGIRNLASQSWTPETRTTVRVPLVLDTQMRPPNLEVWGTSSKTRSIGIVIHSLVYPEIQQHYISRQES